MIKELRIENYVKAKTTDDEFNIVKEISFSDNQRGYYLRLEGVNHGVWLEYKGEYLIEGIPLTEEWLFRFGFIYKGIYYNFPLNDIFKLEQYKLNNAYWLRHHSESLDCVKIKYVHQLQNLYFALTNEELKLKQ
jgi:hypothetical protein